MGHRPGQTSMTCRSGALQTHRSSAFHQMHLSERRGRQGQAARLALKFKVTPRDCDSSLPQRGNRRKRWGERKNKGSLLTFSSTHSHTKHVRQPEGPFINTYVEAGTPTPRARNAPYTKNISHIQDPDPAIVLKSLAKTKKKEVYVWYSETPYVTCHW